MIQLPITHGAEVKEGNHVMFAAACSDEPRIIRFLVKQGLDMNGYYYFGLRTSLLTAVDYRCVKSVGCLLELGADLDKGYGERRDLQSPGGCVLAARLVS
jgi:hypothetical protein